LLLPDFAASIGADDNHYEERWIASWTLVMTRHVRDGPANSFSPLAGRRLG
jgi:hypothetical protein